MLHLVFMRILFFVVCLASSFATQLSRFRWNPTNSTSAEVFMMWLHLTINVTLSVHENFVLCGVSSKQFCHTNLFLPIRGACSSIAIGVPALCLGQCQLMIYASLRNTLQYLKEIIHQRLHCGLLAPSWALYFTKLCISAVYAAQQQ